MGPMLPRLNQIVDARLADDRAAVGPPRDAVQRPSAPTSSASSRSTNAARRVSAAKPPPPVAAMAFASPRRSSHRPSISPPIPSAASTTQCEPQPLVPGGATAVEAISRVPREFFVIETHAVLPQTQYPPAQYQSTFIGAGAWETVVFPALMPHTRQQVLCLRQALETMRVRAAGEAVAAIAANAPAAAFKSAAALTVDYTEKEWALHSICFHELARQIKFICREQSELLFEIQAAYDASIARLTALVRQQQQQHDADQTTIASLRQDQRVGQLEAEQKCLQKLDDVTGSTSQVCPCGRSERASSREQWRPKAGYIDSANGRHSEDDDDNDGNDDDEWREFQRQRRLRMREFGTDDDISEDGGGGRLQRASIVEENTAAARVQQAFTKYQQRKEAHRALLRQEKRDAALDIQRSYRGYRERKRALHHRAVMYTILKRRKQVAAVELLQMNVRAYLIKKRREQKHGISGDSESASALTEAQRAAAVAAAVAASSVSPTGSDESDNATEGQQPREADMQAMTGEEATASDRFAQLLNGMSELAAAFSFLHSRRRNANRVKTIKTVAATTKAWENGELTPAGEHAVSGEQHFYQAETSLETNDAAPCEVLATEEESGATDDPEERDLLDATIRRAEDLMLSFRAVISELREGDQCLTKATSTTTLPTDDTRAVIHPNSSAGDETSLMNALGSAAFLFVDDAVDTIDWSRRVHSQSKPRSPSRRGDKADDAMSAVSPTIDDDGDGDDATHLDDVLWQAAVFSPRATEEQDDEASARQLLMRELLASREQQKRHASLKQFIVDIYDTVVGRMRALPRARLEKLVQVHASLAMSFVDGQRLLRGRRVSTRVDLPSTATSLRVNEYEPVSAFVGRINLKDLIRDHFHCHVGLAHLVEAAMERLDADVRQFMGLDPDVHRFHEYLTCERPLEDLVFFCLCRLFARDSKRSSRQPVFHDATMRELVDVACATEIASHLFHACGDDASMVQTDAFVIEPTNEIYTRHLPSNGLQQLEVILHDYVTPVDHTNQNTADDGFHLKLDQHVRATNASHFHAREYNANAPRSPLRRRDGHSSTSGSSSSSWLFFTDLVDLLRRYRSVTRHFHAFIDWTYELFHEAFRHQRQQQLLDADGAIAASTVAMTGTPLLEEASFVQTLLPYSLGAGDRELRNVFHNALKQRQLQRLMPVRVFVSVVLVLLRNGLLSVTSYQALQRPVDAAIPSSRSRLVGGASYLGTHRRQREEKQWLQLALQWRAHEQHFEAAVERLYAATDLLNGSGGGHVAAAARLLQLRNELYELFMRRAGRENLERAQKLYEQLTEAMSNGYAGDDDVNVPETNDEDSESPHRDRDATAYDGVAVAVGSPWTTREPESDGA